MHINLKWIIIGIILLGLLALFIWGDHVEPGSIFAGLAGFIAALKSKLFGNNILKLTIEDIENKHQLKRDEWEKEKREYDKQYDILKLKLDSLDNRTEILKEQLRRASQNDYQPKRRTEAEILEWLKK